MTKTRFILLIVLCFIAGALCYVAVTEYGIANSVRLRAEEVTRLRAQALSKLFQYGTVESSDPVTGTMTFSSNARDITVHLDSDTLIRKEVLQADATGTYISISEPVAGTITDLSAGTHVAVSFAKVNGVLYAYEILFGDPL